MKKTWPSIFFFLICATLGTARQVSRDDAGIRFHNQVTAIAAGADSRARGNAIIKQLDELGIKYRLQPFTHKGKSGTNIIAELPGKSAQNLLLGAHYDRVEKGQGAVDNASGVTVVLELLATLKANPLKNYAVSAVFFDLHEAGLFGTTEYVAWACPGLVDSFSLVY